MNSVRERSAAMNDNGRPPDPSPEELKIFRENQRKVPLEEILPHAGKHVAWSLDGLHVVASGDDVSEVNQRVIAAGIPPNRVVFDYIDEPDVSYI
jgi:hypothetical protein